MTKYTALIVEPRKHNALYFVLNNFLSNLSDDWSIIIFHGNQNIEYVTNIVEKLKEKHTKIMKLIHLNVNNLDHITYSHLFMSETFYQYIPTETFLVFQTDSMIIKENKDLINSFLKYDYVGAPWKSTEVGNGGLSLRKKSKMLEIIRSKGHRNMHEDTYFSLNIHPNISYDVPTFSEAKQFSVETVFYDSPFGIHNCWNFLKPEDMMVLTNKYSEILELINLQ